MKNNQPFTLPDNCVFQNKILSSSNTVPQLGSNNEGGTQALPPRYGGTAPDTIGGLHHMVDDVLASQYVVQTKYVCENHNNSFSDPELS